VDAACGPISDPVASPAPVNSCPQHACSKYVGQPGLTCGAEGSCTAPPIPGVVLVVSLPTDSAIGPSLQYVMPLDRLRCDPTTEPCDPDCTWPACGQLPPPVTARGGYLMSACVQLTRQKCPLGGLGFFLGNENAAGGIDDTWLPVNAIFQMLRDPWGTEVASLGLPVRAVRAAQIVNTLTTQHGPYGGTAYAYQVSLPPGTYERAVAPVPSFDAIFAPSVRQDSPQGQFEELAVEQWSITKQVETPTASPLGTNFPTFDISMAPTPDGRPATLDGWTAFFRDQTTKEVLSNVWSLSGTDTPGVLLVTNNDRPDALTNAALVIAPPAGAPYPTGVYNPLGELSDTIVYPGLPAPVTVTGAVTAPDGSPVDADIAFWALAVTDATGTFNDTYFEFTATASARAAASPDHLSSYSVTLPAAPYEVTVRPLDTSLGTLVTTVAVDAQDATQDFSLVPPLHVGGRALLSDTRELASAIVEALPRSCAAPAQLVDAGPMGGLKHLDTTPLCLPRPSQTTTRSDGSFSLSVDPGGYTLRVRPAAGTNLPWAMQAVSVTSMDATANFTVPAPYHASFKLVGSNGSAFVPVARALVQAYVPAPSPGTTAVELGETLTSADGQCDLYLGSP
jgi:hypothetical protein